MLKNKLGRPSLEKKRITISVRLDPDLLEDVRLIPDLCLTQAVENGLRLVLSKEIRKTTKLSSSNAFKNA